MARKRAGHPTWFKLSSERAEFLKTIPAETAVTCLLNCFTYLETREKPALDPLDSICFSAFLPDLENAWSAYEQRTGAGFRAGERGTAVHGRDTSYTGALDIDQDQEPEEERDQESEKDQEPDKDLPGLSSGGLAVPSVGEVQSFAQEHKLSAETAEQFYKVNSERSWRINGAPIRNWQKLLLSWGEHEKKPTRSGVSGYTEAELAASQNLSL